MPTPSPNIITIDGLAASGKSTVARQVALALGWPYVSSGLLYRAVAVAALDAGISTHSEAGLLECLAHNDVGIRPEMDGNTAWVSGKDITQRAHSSAVDAVVSTVAQHPKVRSWVNASIRALPAPFVAEGRDMGGVVFRDAPIKLYLTASSHVRAARRTLERPEDLEAVQAAIDARDAQDAINARPANDAIQIDTSKLNLEQVVRRALELIANKNQALHAQEV